VRVLRVVGARPQFMQAPVAREALLARGHEHLLVHTGQHYDEGMSAVFFRELGLPEADVNLGVAGLSHGAMTGRMLEEIEKIILAERPDWVLVYGDTNSTLAGALAAVKLHVGVAHVEAGLRSWNRAMPEEINRVATDHVAALLFAPTATAVTNLRNEGMPDNKIVRTGDVMQDAALHYAAAARDRSLPAGLDAGMPFALITVHRAENTDDPARLAAIVTALQAVARARRVVFPVHPRTRNALERLGLLAGLEAVATLLPPVGYLDMVALESAAAVIVTDSGGVQKEAYFFARPCVTLRTETEWTELVEAGANVLVAPDDPAAMQAAIEAAFTRRVDTSGRLYGDGHAAAQIIDALCAAPRGAGD